MAGKGLYALLAALCASAAIQQLYRCSAVDVVLCNTKHAVHSRLAVMPFAEHVTELCIKLIDEP